MTLLLQDLLNGPLVGLRSPPAGTRSELEDVKSAMLAISKTDRTDANSRLIEECYQTRVLGPLQRSPQLDRAGYRADTTRLDLSDAQKQAASQGRGIMMLPKAIGTPELLGEIASRLLRHWDGHVFVNNFTDTLWVFSLNLRKGPPPLHMPSLLDNGNIPREMRRKIEQQLVHLDDISYPNRCSLTPVHEILEVAGASAALDNLSGAVMMEKFFAARIAFSQFADFRRFLIASDHRSTSAKRAKAIKSFHVNAEHADRRTDPMSLLRRGMLDTLRCFCLGRGVKELVLLLRNPEAGWSMQNVVVVFQLDVAEDPEQEDDVARIIVDRQPIRLSKPRPYHPDMELPDTGNVAGACHWERVQGYQNQPVLEHPYAWRHVIHERTSPFRNGLDRRYEARLYQYYFDESWQLPGHPFRLEANRIIKSTNDRKVFTVSANMSFCGNVGLASDVYIFRESTSLVGEKSVLLRETAYDWPSVGNWRWPDGYQQKYAQIERLVRQRKEAREKKMRELE